MLIEGGKTGNYQLITETTAKALIEKVKNVR